MLYAIIFLLGTGLALPSPESGLHWVAGDFHVHSTGASDDTDQKSFPEDIKKIALKRGLSFVMLSDHSNAMGPTENSGPDFVYWKKAEELTEPGKFLMVDSVEISPLTMGGAGHVNFLPSHLTPTIPSVAFLDRPKGKITGKMAIDQAHWLGGLAVVNHPFSAVAPWIEFDWTSKDYDGLEIYNGGLQYDKGDIRSTEAFFCDLSEGKKTFPIGASDCHRAYTPYPGTLMDSALGFARTWVAVRELTWPNILEALKKGRVVVGDQENFITFTVEGKSLGETLPAKPHTAYPVTIEGTTLSKNLVRLLFIPYGSCEDTRAKNRHFRVRTQTLYKKEIPAGTFALKTPLVFPSPGALLAFLGKPHRSRRVHNIAISNALFIQIVP